MKNWARRGFALPLTLVVIVIMHLIYLSLLSYQNILMRQHEGFQLFHQSLIQKDLVSQYHEEQFSESLPSIAPTIANQMEQHQTQVLSNFTERYDCRCVEYMPPLEIYYGKSKYNQREILLFVSQHLLLEENSWAEKLYEWLEMPTTIISQLPGQEDLISAFDYWDEEAQQWLIEVEDDWVSDEYQWVRTRHRQLQDELHLSLYLDTVFDFGDSYAYYTLEEYPDDPPDQAAQFCLTTTFDSAYYHTTTQTMPSVPTIRYTILTTVKVYAT